MGLKHRHTQKAFLESLGIMGILNLRLPRRSAYSTTYQATINKRIVIFKTEIILVEKGSLEIHPKSMNIIAIHISSHKALEDITCSF